MPPFSLKRPHSVRWAIPGSPGTSRSAWAHFMCVMAVSWMTALLSYGQVAEPAPGQTAYVGTVATSGKNTLVVRTDSDQVVLFGYDRYTVKPASIAVGARVRVFAIPSGDEAVHIARWIMLDSSPTPATQVAGKPVPTDTAGLQAEIENAARKFHAGFEGGVALDPELIVIGVQARFGPFFNQSLFFRL